MSNNIVMKRLNLAKSVKFDCCMEKVTMSKKFLNLGCGGKFVPGWTNIDLVSSSPHVDEVNFLNGLPFPDETFEVIYSSQVLEHFDKVNGHKLLLECRRVLMPGGILRIVVPDLEDIAVHYLSCLHEVKKNPSKKNKLQYDWALIELLDQLVRTTSGGMMKQFLMELDDKSMQEHVVGRCGQVVKSIIDGPQKVNKVPMFSRLKNKIRQVLKKITQPQKFWCNDIHSSGELHKWMYDSYSLSRLLDDIGLKNIVVVSPEKSRIENWESYSLDVANGVAIDPKSLFVECQK